MPEVRSGGEREGWDGWINERILSATAEMLRRRIVVRVVETGPNGGAGLMVLPPTTGEAESAPIGIESQNRRHFVARVMRDTPEVGELANWDLNLLKEFEEEE